MRTAMRAAAAAAMVLTLSTSASAASSMARWELDEARGAEEMSDSSGQGLDGTVGADVVTGVGWSGMQAFRFPTVSPNALPVRPGHTVVVDDDPRLDPGSRTYTVELRLRPAGREGNIMQKGQSRTAGGFWKLELNAGEPTCLFRAPDGTTNSVRARGDDIVDGRFHTIRCVRTVGAVELWVDGAYVGRNTGQTGSIANDHELSIGGKQRCNQVSVGCDYFSGDIDWIRITTG